MVKIYGSAGLKALGRLTGLMVRVRNTDNVPLVGQHFHDFLDRASLARAVQPKKRLLTVCMNDVDCWFLKTFGPNDRFKPDYSVKIDKSSIDFGEYRHLMI